MHPPKRKLLTFAGSTATTATVLLAAGWLTGVREVMHGAVLTLAVVAFFPFVLIVAGIMVVVGGCLLIILFGCFAGGGDVPIASLDGVEPIVAVGAWFVPHYYRFWARRRHPGLWGVPFGALVGCLLLGGLLAILVIPGEAATVRALEEAQRRADRAYDQHKHYPAPDAMGRLSEAAFGDDRGQPDDILRDGFGRPLLYRVSGRGRVASYSIQSLGFDGRPGRDDLCLAGQTRLMGWADAAGGIARHVISEQGSAGEAILGRLRGIRSLNCGP